MSRSSASDGVSGSGRAGPGRTVERREHRGPAESSRCRGQVEPFAALVAVLAVGLAISLYATVLSDADPGGSDRNVADIAVDRVYRNVSDGSVVEPGRIARAPAVAPAGYETNVTLAVGEATWRAGPSPPESAERASRRVNVRLAPGNVRPGRLTVVIWS